MKSPEVALFASSASAIEIYSQCGGKGWSSSGTCNAGLTCSTINAYYYQCLSATGIVTTTQTTPTPVGPATSKTSTTTTPASTTIAPTSAKSTASSTTTSAASSPSNIVGNFCSGNQIYANPYYASEISKSAIPSLPASLAAQASQVAEVGTCVWLDAFEKVPTMGTYLSNIETMNAAGAKPEVIGAFVIYDLLNRDCAAAASNGQYTVANNGVEYYKEYIDSIVAQVKAFPTVDTVFVVEPDSLANLVTNLDVANCSAARTAYITCIEYAISELNLPNVAMSLDAGHAGWLGWPANIGPVADLFAEVYQGGGSPAAVRGLATNVANYNAFTIASPPSYTSGDPNYDEQLYIHALAPLLTSQGFPAHFITDTSRNGVQPTAQLAWGDWCNDIGTGFGVRPTANTGDSLVDAFVWVKPGGECDGTSNSTAPRYDYHCSLADALQPSPQAGTWFEAYFEQLLQNANQGFQLRRTCCHGCGEEDGLMLSNIVRNLSSIRVVSSVFLTVHL